MMGEAHSKKASNMVDGGEEVFDIQDGLREMISE